MVSPFCIVACNPVQQALRSIGNSGALSGWWTDNQGATVTMLLFAVSLQTEKWFLVASHLLQLGYEVWGFVVI